MPTLDRHWVCPKCAATFQFTEFYGGTGFKAIDKASRAQASARISQKIATTRIKHKTLGCGNHRPSRCFLSSACLISLGLPDDCFELTTLRQFRDRHLLASPEGRRLVEDYYRIAPTIVTRIGTDSPVFWRELYGQLVHPTVAFITKRAYYDAREYYKEFVLDLAEGTGLGLMTQNRGLARCF
jgi:hypothetical protein